jgi:hypothetical protein
VTRIIVLVASLATVAALAVAAPTAGAAERPSLVDAVAAKLGVSPDKLRDAFKTALAQRVDAAVAAGNLTPEQGAKMKERIAKGHGLGLGAGNGLAKRHKAFADRIAKAKAKAKAKGRGPAAEYLGMTHQELVAELRAGKSLAQVARAKGKSVAGLVAAMVAPAKAALAKAVENHRLDAKRADEILERVTEGVEKLVERAPRTS